MPLLNNLVRFINENRIIENILILVIAFSLIENNLKITSLKQKINKNHVETIKHLDRRYSRVDNLVYINNIYSTENEVYQTLITKRLNKISNELTINTNIQNEIFDIIYNDLTPLIKNVCNKSYTVKEPLASNDPLFPINENSVNNDPIPANTYSSYIKYAPYENIPDKPDKTIEKNEEMGKEPPTLSEIDIAFNQYVEDLRDIMKIYNIPFEDYVITNISNTTMV